ncbi:MAG: hypothetical protein EZS28_040087, partial [Streblomastix strix]
MGPARKNRDMVKDQIVIIIKQTVIQELEFAKAFVVHELSVSFSFIIGTSCYSSALLNVQTSELSVCPKFPRVGTSQCGWTNEELISLPE